MKSHCDVIDVDRACDVPFVGDSVVPVYKHLAEGPGPAENVVRVLVTHVLQHHHDEVVQRIVIVQV